LQHIYCKYKLFSECSAEYLTIFAVKRDIFQTFFEYTSITVLSTFISRISVLQLLLLQRTNLSSYLSARLSLFSIRNSDLIFYLSEYRLQSESVSFSATELTILLFSISTQSRFTHTIKRSAEIVYSQSAWQLARLYSKFLLNNILIVIFSILFYNQALFRIEKSSIKKILQIAKILDIREQNVKYIYISYNNIAELKFIDSKTIVQQAYKTKKQIIFKISLDIVDKLKYQYKAIAQQVILQNSQ